jgi:hypothetical protein
LYTFLVGFQVKCKCTSGVLNVLPALFSILQDDALSEVHDHIALGQGLTPLKYKDSDVDTKLMDLTARIRSLVGFSSASSKTSRSKSSGRDAKLSKLSVGQTQCCVPGPALQSMQVALNTKAELEPDHPENAGHDFDDVDPAGCSDNYSLRHHRGIARWRKQCTKLKRSGEWYQPR